VRRSRAKPAARQDLTPPPGASDVPPPADEPPARHTPEAPAGAESDAERLQAARAASVIGKLTDRAGDPIAGARIFVRHEPELGAPYDRARRFAAHLPLDLVQPEALACDAPRSAVSGAGGEFSLGGLPPGRLALLVVHPDWVPLARNDLLAAGGRARWTSASSSSSPGGASRRASSMRAERPCRARRSCLGSTSRTRTSR
jgi:hypothetical protein